MPERLRAAVAFAGLRVSEACGLRVRDIDFMRGIARPAVQYPAEPLKTEASRTAIPIPPSMALALSAHVAAHPGEWLLTDQDGGQVNPKQLMRQVRLARGKVGGLPAGFRFHDLRHYFASLLIASGADIKTVQARVRHASAKNYSRHLRAPMARPRREHEGGRRGGLSRSCGLSADGAR